MDNAHVLILFVLSLSVLTVTCQTYHYSPPDWTNRKRSMSMLEEIVNFANKNAGQSDNVLVNCELQKLRLLLQGSINNQLFQVPCDLLTSGKKSFSENTIIDHFHRQPTPVNNNY
ncbi:pro-corazonin-like [Bombus pyrosoma]|uniref:pro-corazonin-like n=1 Tax=Bombus pyrosoma TaxID=396416 RepID=UPI001CB91ABB|nr:pro-corazonin-like [Bombus pyrosoma]